MNRKVLLAGAAIILPILLILGANLGTDPRRIRSPLIGKAAPPFELKAVGSNERISLDALRGRPVLLNFWATWCVPCYQEHAVLSAAAGMPDNRVQFVGVVYNDEEEKAIKFLQQNGHTYANAMDDGARTAMAYGVYGVPETFFIDANGVIVDKFEGPLDADTLRAKLREVTK